MLAVSCRRAAQLRSTRQLPLNPVGGCAVEACPTASSKAHQPSTPPRTRPQWRGRGAEGPSPVCGAGTGRKGGAVGAIQHTCALTDGHTHCAARSFLTREGFRWLDRAAAGEIAAGGRRQRRHQRQKRKHSAARNAGHADGAWRCELIGATIAAGLSDLQGCEAHGQSRKPRKPNLGPVRRGLGGSTCPTLGLHPNFRGLPACWTFKRAQTCL